MAEETRKAKLSLEVESRGAEKAAKEIASIQKGATALQKELGKMARESQLDDLAKEFGQIAKETGETGKAVGDLTKKLKELGATDDEIKGVARSFEAARSGSGGGGGGGGAPAAAKFRGAASLIGGGEIVGLIDDLQDLGEGLGELADVAPNAAQGLLGVAASMGPTGLLVAGAAAAAVVTLGVAVKGLADESQKAFDTVSGILDEQRSIREQVASGATVEDLTAQLEEVNRLRQLEADALKRNQTLYDEQFKADGFVDGFSQLFNGAEQALAEDLDKSAKSLEEYDIKIRELQNAIDSGIAPAGEAKAAEQELAQVRSTEAPAAAKTASDAERERAKAAQEAEKAQAKAAADAERAAEKAAQDAERNAERAAQAQENYNKAIKDAGRNLKEATEDINTKLGQTLADNLTGLLRDATDLASKYRQDESDLAMKAQRDERDALTDHLRSIEDIQQDARKSEQEAIRDGDFKQLFLARQAAAENLRDEQKADLREKQDRQRALTDERSDLLKNAVRERADRLLNYERQNADARLNAQREMQQAQLAKTRSLALAQESYSAELKQLGQYLQQRNQMQAQANAQSLQQMSAGSRVSQNGMIPTAPGNGMISAPTSGFAVFPAIIRKR